MSVTTATVSTIQINGIDYVPANSVNQTPLQTGNRIVAVIDRGWIWAGDRYECENGYIGLRNVVWVFNWEQIGFDTVITDPTNKKANLRPLPGHVIEIPPTSLIIQIPVVDDWGLNSSK